MRGRALVVGPRVPEIDRDSGSQRADLYMRWLREEGWSVTFVSAQEESEFRHCHRLRQLGVPTYVGFGRLEELVDAGDFDLALLGFWEPAAEAMPIIRERSPRTHVIVDSVDLHFLRDGRQAMRVGMALEPRFGERFVAELNTYQAADAVLAVSDKETDTLADFLGADRARALADAREIARSPFPFEQRRGVLFVGNFRHLPNGEAVEHLCRDILPRIDSGLLAEHPLTVVGSRLDAKIRAHARGLAGVRMIGWVPSVAPYLERARASAVPLLHGAGVKGKIVESLMVGTPVVTTPIGAEGIGLIDGENAIVGSDPDVLAAGLSRMLVDAGEWERLANAGHELVSAKHGVQEVRARFLEIVEEVMARPARRPARGIGQDRVRRRELAYRESVAAASRVLATITEPDSKVMVVSRGDDRLVSVQGRTCLHFPQAPDGRWAGYHPVDSSAAISHLESLRGRGARYLAIPSSSFWWLHHYDALTDHLDARYRRIHSGEHLVVFDVGEEAQRNGSDPGEEREDRGRVLVVGTHAGGEGPPAALRAALERCDRYAVKQQWGARGKLETGSPGPEPSDAAADADWIVHLDDSVVLPDGFLDDFLGAASQLLDAGCERFQPAHGSGPSAGPPVTERLRGAFAREVPAATPIPLLARRAGTSPKGSVALIDVAPIALAKPVAGGDPLEYADVGDVFVVGSGGPARAVHRSGGAHSPLISVLVSTYERPELLAGCLEGFCEQDLPAADFEVVVVDDGSAGERTAGVIAGFADRLALTWARIEHAGRSAAKNLAVMLARGEVVLFFDDDDAPAADLLSEHLRAHDEHPDESTAVLGYTGWDPSITVSPLMNYLTEVDKLLFSYGNLAEDARSDWRGFWEGRVSSKRSLHLRHGLHDQRLAYSIDVEMAWRLAGHGLEVVYRPAAQSVMSRPITFEDFCNRQEAKGRAQAAIAELHDEPDLLDYLKIEGAAKRWAEALPKLGATVARIEQLEASLAETSEVEFKDEALLSELHGCYRSAFAAYNAKGIAEGIQPPAPQPRGRGRRPSAAVNGGGEAPALTVTMPVWSKTPALAAMAEEMIDRVWEVASMPTEVVVIDNGSPEEHPSMNARIHRFEENRGVASGWNAGIELARAPVIAVLNSDCRVEPGWDEALYEAATSGRRIAFPYTDHCDGRGFRRPDQAGTAGWCFMLARDVREEIGWFDERFNPAYVEDTDYWHRAWELGIELSPVPQARVTHARRTSASDRSDWLLTGHRYLYGWKHGVEPMRAPPFYNREISDYQSGQGSVRSAPTT